MTDTDTLKESMDFWFDYKATVAGGSLSSSWVKEAWYNVTTEDLLIFIEDAPDPEKAFVYSQVPVHMFGELTRTDSAGAYYNDKIKGKFACQKMEPAGDVTLHSKPGAEYLLNTVWANNHPDDGGSMRDAGFVEISEDAVSPTNTKWLASISYRDTDYWLPLEASDLRDAVRKVYAALDALGIKDAVLQGVNVDE